MKEPDRIQLDSFQMTILSDGAFRVSRDFFLAGGDPHEAEHYPEEFEVALNFIYLETNGKRMLIDTGFGETGGQESGYLIHHLTQAGIKPDSIDYVILSHSHLDHTGGLLNNGKPAFPNAVHLISEAEWLYAKQTPASEQFRILSAVRPLLKLLIEDTELLPGLKLIHTPGHTPGHLTIELQTKDGVCQITNDVFHIPESISNPKLRVSLEHDPIEGEKTRRLLARQAYNGQVLLHGCHFPYPGFGLIEKQGSLFQWKPVQYEKKTR
ncbi:MBL fold metallo-hydrolase [Bacillus paralicheniformis]|nr:MBL fold metallo-hydrolase [Bacillus paralicheniformis]MSO04780.1 MBL fold metallo-hydrolase [Bacillus paralicheniformis]MSO08773.1 MBL fold metallo-hydrolase [Bacillus paralicheniformis]MSO12767.1 MBL fold metallo-hydrolase [Bacillus paralicheniformis]NJE39265.1 MBL fold metallo-hydrolase [Bacillus paralicheniformis]